MIPQISNEKQSNEMTDSIMSDIGKKSCEKECKDIGKKTKWEIKCPKCGVMRIMQTLVGYKNSIKRNTSCKKCKKSSRFVDITGRKFRKLIVIKRVDNDLDGHLMWLCKCDCGNEIITRGESLRNKYTQSCGCYHKRQIQKRPYEWVFRLLLRSAKSTKRFCNLIYEDILDFTKYTRCQYCKCEIKWESHQTPECSVAYYIDRKDNNIGYIKENCIVCCSDCNRIKSNKFTYEEMVKLGNVIGEIRNSRCNPSI